MLLPDPVSPITTTTGFCSTVSTIFSSYWRIGRFAIDQLTRGLELSSKIRVLGFYRGGFDFCVLFALFDFTFYFFPVRAAGASVRSISIVNESRGKFYRYFLLVFFF